MLMLRVGVYVCFPVGLRARSCVHVWSNMFVQCLLPVRCVFACACACARPPPAANRKIRKLIDRNFGPYVKTGALSLVASAVSVKDRSAGSKPAGLMPPIFYFSKFSNMTSFSVRIFGVLSFSLWVFIARFRRSGLFVRAPSGTSRRPFAPMCCGAVPTV